MTRLRTTYDPVANAAYVYFTPATAPRTVSRSAVVDLDFDQAALIADLDSAGRIVGLELLGVSRLLPASSLSVDSLALAVIDVDARRDVASLALGDAANSSPALTQDVALIDESLQLRVGLVADGHLVTVSFPAASKLLP